MTEPDARVGDVGTSPILAKPVSTPPAPHGTTPAVDGGDSWWRSDASEAVRRNLALVGVLLMIFVVGAVTAPEVFLDAQRLWDNEMTVLRQSAAIGVVTVGMTFVIIGGGIDLSVGALLALSSVWATTIATQEFGPAGIVFTALTVGTVGGLVNGLLISYGRIVPFIATLAMLVAARGLAQLMSGKLTQRVSTENRAINQIAEINVIGIPLLVVILMVVAVLGWVLLNRTTFGRRTFAIGGNPEAARLAGINLRVHTVLLYVLSGLCCGIAAIMVTSLGNAGSSTHGDLYELDAIAAAIIGGTVLAGGRGSIVGAILGVVIFSGITNLLIINNMVQEWRLIVKGAIIIAAVLVQQFGFGWRRRKTPKVAAT